ncbi:uncharacterized protein DEA37_0004307 [Paragonimus westermani]|uniref:Reverse transcriptase domain-containing protein n=1 Tax=Paragonimus westermani TaxID=34504 RepID=A0A5J4N6L6_9TREM|nr:uncharacterized protein DEA37_0004307 [Paragonimus westermani]
MTSFDVGSLITNVLLEEFINIFCNYTSEHELTPGIPIDELSKLKKMSASEIQFLFNDTFYRQTDGVAIGSPLGSVLTDIYMGHLEHAVSTEIRNTLLYKRHVDDIFAELDDHCKLTIFHQMLSGLHGKSNFILEFVQTTEYHSRTFCRKEAKMGNFLEVDIANPLGQDSIFVLRASHQLIKNLASLGLQIVRRIVTGLVRK